MIKIKQETLLAKLRPPQLSELDELVQNQKNINREEDISRLIVPPGCCTKEFIYITDSLLSLFIISPMVVSHWNATWALIGIYTQHFTPLNSFLFGCLLHTCFVLIKDLLHKSFSTAESNCNKSLTKRISRFIAMKTYTYIFGWGCNLHWWGGWELLHILNGSDMIEAILEIVISVVILIFLKSIRNLLGPPTTILTDSKYLACSFPNRFRVEGSREPGLYVLDCVFSVLIVGTLVVVAWRGVWVMFDIILYPGNKAFSAFGSLIIGYGIVAITFALQPIMRWTCDRLTGFCRLAVADIFLFLSFIGTVNVWRGVWMMLDVYLLPEQHVLSCWITHAVSFLVLALLNCSNSVLVRGVYIDAEEPAGECVIFPIDYIRLYFQKERTKKQKRLLDALIEKQDDQNYIEDKQTLITHNNIKIINNSSNNNNNSNNNKNNNNTKQHFIKIDGPGSIINSSEIKPMLTTTSISGKTTTTITTTANEKHNLNSGDNNNINNE